MASLYRPLPTTRVPMCIFFQYGSKILRRYSTSLLCKTGQTWSNPQTWRLLDASPFRRSCVSTDLIGARPAASSADDNSLWMIVGLGNPGLKYDGTRHNVGFEVIDGLARLLGCSVTKIQDNAAVGRAELNGKKVLLAKPMTFMNNSGEAVMKLSKYYKIPADRILVIYDDLDLPVGTVRLRAKGGHGGHNGMRSIIQYLGGSKDFPRVRIGIGQPPGHKPVASYVLESFGKKEREEIDFAVQESMDVVRSVLSLGIDKAVSGVRV